MNGAPVTNMQPAKRAEAPKGARRQSGVMPQACYTHDAKLPEAAPAFEARERGQRSRGQV